MDDDRTNEANPDAGAGAETGVATPRPFDSVPIEIIVSVGKARPLIRDLMTMGRNAVLTLDRRIEDPVELYVGDRLVARGQLEQIEGEHGSQLAVRLSEIADLQSGLG